MEYLVMECALSYAVVLDSEGRFLKVPNLGYEVGQVLEHVVIQELSPMQQTYRKRFTQWAAMAACLCLIVLGSFGFWQSPVGTVRMQINPDIQMSVNRFDRVIGINGLNEDGNELIKGYHSYGKSMKAVSDELADRAIKKGYLSDGGQITLTVESKRKNWKTATEEMLLLELDVHLDHRITVVNTSDDSSEKTEPQKVIVIEPDKISPEHTDDSANDLKSNDTNHNVHAINQDDSRDDNQNDDDRDNDQNDDDHDVDQHDDNDDINLNNDQDDNHDVDDNDDNDNDDNDSDDNDSDDNDDSDDNNDNDDDDDN